MQRSGSCAPALRDLQALLYRLITFPEGVEAGLQAEPASAENGLEPIIAGDDRMSARERLEIYANAYFYRLLKACKHDFPCTHKVLGEINFHNLITGYLVDYPPDQPSLYHAGGHLPDYLGSHQLLEQFPFAADLARLERTTIEVFHSPDTASLAESALRRLASEAWPSLLLRLHPAARVLHLEWRVDKLMTAIKLNHRWEPPEREPASLLIWRREWNVRYRAPNRVENAALEAIRDGATLASICDIVAAAETSIPAFELPDFIHGMLAGWLKDGLLESLDF
jgi:Putative DNA-binding domain